MTRTRSRSRKIAFAVVACVAVLALVEVAFRVVEIWQPPEAYDLLRGFDPASRVFEEADDPAYRVTRAEKRAAFRLLRFRAEKEPGTLRVAVLGGSAMFYLADHLQILAERLEQRFTGRYRRVEVLDLGGKSYGSHRLVMVLAELLEYGPDAVVVCSGNNELEEMVQLRLAGLESATLGRQLSWSAAVRFARDRIRARQLAALREEHNQQLLARPFPDYADYAGPWHTEFTAQDVDGRLVAFGANLRTLVGMCRSRGIPVVLGTVPSNHFRPLLRKVDWPAQGEATKLYRDGKHAEGHARMRALLDGTLARHQSSDRENRVIREVAAEAGVPLADVEAAVIEAEPHGVPGETLFRDHCHFNGRGMNLWIRTLEPVLAAALEPPSDR